MSERDVTISELEARAIVARLRTLSPALTDREKLALASLNYQLGEYDRELSRAAPDQLSFDFGDV